MALSISVGVAGYEYLDDRLTKDGCPLRPITLWDILMQGNGVTNTSV